MKTNEELKALDIANAGKELTSEELVKIAGGKLSPEAEEWLNMNEDNLRASAKAAGKLAAFEASIQNIRNHRGIFSLDEVQSICRRVIDGY